MDAAILIVRMGLAAVFGTAGLAKIADPARTRRTLVDFGVPPALASPLGLLLPATELVVAAALLSSATAWWGAVCALALLLLFAALIGFNLARGRRPDCRCFGELHSARVGGPTLARNLVLAAAAAFVVWQDGTRSAPDAAEWRLAWLWSADAGLLIGAVVIGLLAVEGWLLVHLLRQNGRLLLRIEALELERSAGAGQPVVGLPVGAPAPGFELATLSGGTVTLDALRGRGKPVLLLFSDPGCGPCAALMPEAGRWQRDLGSLTVAVISRGPAETSRRSDADYGLNPVLLQTDREVAALYEIPGTPSAVIVRPDGTVGGPVAVGADAIRALVARARKPAPERTRARSETGGTSEPVVP
jgi:peroxiredoxin/uncharacterized membrane protein YphA (DoxX/SURF4 family)